MPKFPVDAPQEKVIKAFELLGFHGKGKPRWNANTFDNAQPPKNKGLDVTHDTNTGTHRKR